MKRNLRRIISLMLTVIMITGIASFSFAAENTETAGIIKFGTDGKLRIMHVTDTHLEDSNLDASVWAIGEACDREKPNLVVITGDNVQNCDNPEDTKRLIDGLMNVFESRNIPVAVTFGNHDSESGAMSREELMAYYNTFSCSVSVDDGFLLSGCGTYNIPVFSSDGTRIKFNLWVFDSGDYDGEGHYGCVQADQVEWYKATSDMLTAANGGKKVYSLAFQHIIVPEVYDALRKAESESIFTVEHLYSEDDYTFDPEGTNYGMLLETPCSGYENYGQFDAMVEKGDVLAVFSGHDHTNAFGVRHKGIDIINSLSTRYDGNRFSTQYGYRMIEIDENNTSVYTTDVVHWYEIFDFGFAFDELVSGDRFGFKTSLEIAFLGIIQRIIAVGYITLGRLVTGEQILYGWL